MAFAVYDMDLTITRRATLTPWLVSWARRAAPWRLLLLPVAAGIGAACLLGLVRRETVKIAAQRLLMGKAAARADVERAAAAFAARIVASGLRPGAIAQLAADRAAGLTIVLATASFDFYVDAIAARLGIDRVVATRSVWAGDALRPGIDGENCYGAAKLAMIDAALPGADIAAAYSDHVSDAPLLERARRAVAVVPSTGLRRLAACRNWTIADW